mmetsp:Transcript_70014/g.85920  ORF Transcript_70014/g.85920 Transcript_70014/m.85920 type:complete len:270 (-) Transcript_70014:429-1238(-)
MADTQTNGQVEGKEAVWHRFSPKLSGDHLLVEDLPNGSMHDEHGEGQGSQGRHRFGPKELRDGRRTLGQGIPVHGFQKLGEEWHEEHATDDGIVEIKLGQSKCKGRICSQEKPKWVHGFLSFLLFGVKHHMTSSDDAGGHLKERPDGMETGQVPNQWHHHFSIHGMFLAAVETGRLRVADLLQQGDSPQSSKKFLQTVLGEIGHLWQDQGGHSEIGEGQGRQEPSGLVPDLGFLGEPRLQHAEVQEGAEGDHLPGCAEVPLHPNKHWGK